MNPFEHDELMKMNTTNNIELCTFKKIIHQQNSDAFGLINRPVVTTIVNSTDISHSTATTTTSTYSQIDKYELVSLYDSILILALQNPETKLFTFRFE